jgi:hypothetical protein
LPFDKISLSAEQDLWQAGANGDTLKAFEFFAHVPRNAGSKHEIGFGNSPIPFDIAISPV